VGNDAAPVYALPHEEVVREVVRLVPVELVGEEAGETGAAQELRDPGRVTEGVGEPGGGAPATEPLLEVPLAVEQLPREGLAAGDLAVRLDPRAPHGLPPALRDALLDPLEQPRFVALDPLVELGRGLVEVEVLVAVHEIQDARERASRLAPGLGDGPEPREIQVRVAGEREPSDGRVLLPYPLETASHHPPRLAHRLPRLLRQRTQGAGGGRQAPGLAEMTVDLHGFLGVVGREALRHAADGVDEPFEVAGEGHVRGGRPGGGESGDRGVEGVQQARHDLVVVEGGARVEDGREVTL
jgi:hypothetical protein